VVGTSRAAASSSPLGSSIRRHLAQRSHCTHVHASSSSASSASSLPASPRRSVRRCFFCRSSPPPPWSPLRSGRRSFLSLSLSLSFSASLSFLCCGPGDCSTSRLTPCRCRCCPISGSEISRSRTSLYTSPLPRPASRAPDTAPSRARLRLACARHGALTCSASRTAPRSRTETSAATCARGAPDTAPSALASSSTAIGTAVPN